MTAQRVVITLDGVALGVQANVPLPVAVTLLEVAKAKLLSDAMKPPTEATERGAVDTKAPNENLAARLLARSVA